MFKFNFSNNEEDMTDILNVPSNEDFQWYESKEIKIPTEITSIINNVNKEEIINMDFGFGCKCYCISSKEVIKTLKENSDNKNFLNAIEAEKEHSDILSGKYEGGLKIWECTKDLAVYFFKNEVNILKDKLKGKNVLDLGCGSGILGILCLSNGANVTFQDYNEEVLEAMTILNVFLNFDESIKHRVKFCSGDWSSFLNLIKQQNSNCDNSVELKFDYILTSETIYNPNNYSKIIKVFQSLLKINGTAFVAAKNYYFGVGGNLMDFQKYLKMHDFISETCWQTDEGVARGILRVQKQNNSFERKEIIN